jgi:hypothetical protein
VLTLATIVPVSELASLACWLLLRSQRLSGITLAKVLSAAQVSMVLVAGVFRTECTRNATQSATPSEMFLCTNSEAAMAVQGTSGSISLSLALMEGLPLSMSTDPP